MPEYDGPEAKRDFDALLEQVEHGARVTIRRDGRAVARVLPMGDIESDTVVPVDEQVSRPLHSPSVLASVLALLPWLGVLAMFLRWTGHMSAGTIEPGADTSWATLMVLLVFLPLAGMLFAAAVFVAAWWGKRNVRWQVASFVLGTLLLWMTLGD